MFAQLYQNNNEEPDVWDVQNVLLCRINQHFFERTQIANAKKKKNSSEKARKRFLRKQHLLKLFFFAISHLSNIKKRTVWALNHGESSDRIGSRVKRKMRFLKKIQFHSVEQKLLTKREEVGQTFGLNEVDL